MPEAQSSARSYDQLCGIATALDVIGDRWAALVVRDLLLGPLRFGDLVDGLPGVGTNTLTARLKHLQEAGVIRRRLVEAPVRGTVYELTELGRELEPVLMALGRWGAKSMDRLPANAATRSRWLVAAMLAFHDNSRRVSRATIWHLRLSDGDFTVRAVGRELAISAGAPAAADLVIAANDTQWHALISGGLSPAKALRARQVTVDGDPALLDTLISLFAFPAVETGRPG